MPKDSPGAESASRGTSVSRWSIVRDAARRGAKLGAAVSGGIMTPVFVMGLIVALRRPSVREVDFATPWRTVQTIAGSGGGFLLGMVYGAIVGAVIMGIAAGLRPPRKYDESESTGRYC